MTAVAALTGGRRGRGAVSGRLSIEVDDGAEERVGRLIRENPAVIFSRRGCCMSHVMKRLLEAVGADAATIELDQEGEELEAAVAAGGAGLPALFVGGVAVGGLEGLMDLHVRDRLVPVLLAAGALRRRPEIN